MVTQILLAWLASRCLGVTVADTTKHSAVRLPCQHMQHHGMQNAHSSCHKQNARTVDDSEILVMFDLCQICFTWLHWQHTQLPSPVTSLMSSTAPSQSTVCICGGDQTLAYIKFYIDHSTIYCVCGCTQGDLYVLSVLCSVYQPNCFPDQQNHKL